jgi:hypothetical protein
MAIMDQERNGGSESGGTDSLPGSAKKFGTKPYLDKRGREVLNRAARKIHRDQPDWVDDPENPSTSDCLTQLQRGDAGFTDTGIIINLLGKGLNAQEAIVWVLWQHSELEPREIFYAHEGKSHPGRSGVDDQAVRNIKSRIRSAAMKLRVNVDV